MNWSLLPLGTGAVKDGSDSSASSNGDKSITAFDRFWVAFVLVAPVRAVLIVATGTEATPMSWWLTAGALLGAVLVGEALLRRFGSEVIEPLWQGILGALVLLAVAVVGSWVGVSLSDPALTIAFVLLSGAITAFRF